MQIAVAQWLQVRMILKPVIVSTIVNYDAKSLQISSNYKSRDVIYDRRALISIRLDWPLRSSIRIPSPFKIFSVIFGRKSTRDDFGIQKPPMAQIDNMR